MKYKLMFFTGICGSGKSSTAQEISRALEQNNCKIKWLHEECKNNPLRKTKTSFRDSGCSTIDEYLLWSIKIWDEFIHKISSNDFTYIIDGYIFQSTILNLYNDKFPVKIIEQYFSMLSEKLKKINHLIVNLYKTDLQESFKNLWLLRGNRWKKIHIDIPGDLKESEIDYKKYEKEGIKDWENFQNLNAELLQKSSINYFQINTTENDWNNYYRLIMDNINERYQPLKKCEIKDFTVYTGDYFNSKTEQKIVIKYENAKLYCEIFFPFMELLPFSGEIFIFRGLPVKLIFFNNFTSFRFEDNYDWHLTGLIFRKQ